MARVTRRVFNLMSRRGNDERRDNGCDEFRGLVDINALFLFFLHSLKLECEKLASEKIEIQRHYVMVSREKDKKEKKKRRKGQRALLTHTLTQTRRTRAQSHTNHPTVVPRLKCIRFRRA